MSLYLYQNDQQTGPFTEEQVRQMIQAGTITSATLGWKEGQADWIPVSNMMPTGGPAIVSPPAPPKAKGSMLGLISFVFSLISIVIWAILLVAAGMAHNNGTATQGFNMIVGLCFMVGVVLNFVAMVLGIVGAFQSKARTLSIIGACLNGFILVALVGLMLIGLAAKSAGD